DNRRLGRQIRCALWPPRLYSTTGPLDSRGTPCDGSSSPMDFAFSEEHELFRSSVRKFAERELAPHYQRHDRDKSFPEQQLRACAGPGLLGLRIPEAHGGNPHPYLVSGIAAEECSRADFNAAYFPLMYGLIGELIARYASAGLQREWL